MVDHAMMDDIAAEAARLTLTPGSFLRVQTSTTSDSEGRDAILVTLVINDLRTSPISGDDAGDAILKIKQDLQAAGENRSVIVEFATEDDLAADGDS